VVALAADKDAPIATLNASAALVASSALSVLVPVQSSVTPTDVLLGVVPPLDAMALHAAALGSRVLRAEVALAADASAFAILADRVVVRLSGAGVVARAAAGSPLPVPFSSAPSAPGEASSDVA
jgi:hypothetical protein